MKDDVLKGISFTRRPSNPAKKIRKKTVNTTAAVVLKMRTCYLQTSLN